MIIFLSDGECSVVDATMYTLARRAVVLGYVTSIYDGLERQSAYIPFYRKALSFHSVLFGSSTQSFYLNRMAEIAKEVYQTAPKDPLAPPGIPCSYTTALDTVRVFFLLAKLVLTYI